MIDPIGSLFSPNAFKAREMFMKPWKQSYQHPAAFSPACTSRATATTAMLTGISLDEGLFFGCTLKSFFEIVVESQACADH